MTILKEMIPEICSTYQCWTEGMQYSAQITNFHTHSHTHSLKRFSIYMHSAFTHINSSSSNLQFLNKESKVNGKDIEPILHSSWLHIFKLFHGRVETSCGGIGFLSSETRNYFRPTQKISYVLHLTRMTKDKLLQGFSTFESNFKSFSSILLTLQSGNFSLLFNFFFFLFVVALLLIYLRELIFELNLHSLAQY